METTTLSVTEHAVLGLLAEGPSHGFALARQLQADHEVGRILTVRRPLVYRALDRLVASALAVPVQTEKGDAGPNRKIHRVTGEGRQMILRWYDEPVEHVREIRLEFLLKVTLLERSGMSPLALIRAQRAALDATIDALDDPTQNDHVDLWRRHVGLAAASYLDELEAANT
jgi:PadR family transcriptional regulator AphA